MTELLVVEEKATLCKNDKINKIYKIYKDAILNYGPFYKGRKLLDEKVNNWAGRRIGICRAGIGSQIKYTNKILVEGYAPFTLEAIRKHGNKIAEYLEGEVKDRFLRFYKIFKEYDYPIEKNTAEEEIKDDERIKKAKEIRKKLVEEFKNELVDAGL